MNDRLMIPEQAARTVLARATVLDAQSPAIAVDELRAIAAELNVSEASLNTALNEYHVAHLGPVSRRSSLAVAAVGLPTGLIGGSLLATATPFTAPSMWLLITAAGLLSSTGLIVLQSKRPSLNSYVLHNSLLWGGIAAGLATGFTILGDGTGGVMLWAVSYGLKHWLPSTILGAAGVTAALRRDSGKMNSPDTPLLAPVSPVPGATQTRARRLLDWIKGSFRTALVAAPTRFLRLLRTPAVTCGCLESTLKCNVAGSTVYPS
jgi:hypothetical protein